MMISGAMPPAAHMVTSPRLRSRRSSSPGPLPIRIEPVIGDGGEGRLQRRESFARGLRPRIFFSVERETAVLAINRHEAPVEMTARDCRGRALLAFEAERINVLPRNTFEGGHRIGAN